MKFEKPVNENYCGVVVTLKNIIELENCDNVVATSIFGFQAIVKKGSKVGDIGIVFPAETQLSEIYCKKNNLFREKENNEDKSQGGYLENNRRVKAVKFRGHTSSCLFMPLESVSFTGVKANQFVEGDMFDVIGKYEICKKHQVYVAPQKTNRQPKAKTFNRVDTKFIPEHFDTENYFRNAYAVPQDSEIVVTQKLHGTSIRVANTVVARKLSLLEKVLKRLGVKIQEYDYVYGSRKVIKDKNNPFHNHFYDNDVWTTAGEKLKGLIPENFLLYGELIGFTETGAQIQEGYTYNLEHGKNDIYIYRVAFVNSQGLVIDLHWNQVKEFCVSRGLKHVPEIYVGKHEGFDAKSYLDKVLFEMHTSCIPLSDKKLVDEGVCIRVNKLTPYILKAKSPLFFEYESKLLDKGTADLESQGATQE